MTDKKKRYKEVKDNMNIAYTNIIKVMHELVLLEDDVILKDTDRRVINNNLKFCLKIWSKANSRLIEVYMRAMQARNKRAGEVKNEEL